MRASPASSSSSSSETRHLCRCVERYALFERFVDSLDSALRAELGRLQRALFETLLALLPSAPSSSPCTRRAFYRAHAAAALGDDDPAAALAEPPEPPASPPPPVRPVVLSAHARDAALRFLYAHAPDTLATLVLTRIPLRVASDTDTDVGADTDTDADTPAPWTAAVLAPLSPAASPAAGTLPLSTSATALCAASTCVCPLCRTSFLMPLERACRHGHACARCRRAHLVDGVFVCPLCREEAATAPPSPRPEQPHQHHT